MGGGYPTGVSNSSAVDCREMGVCALPPLRRPRHAAAPSCPALPAVSAGLVVQASPNRPKYKQKLVRDLAQYRFPRDMKTEIIRNLYFKVKRRRVDSLPPRGHRARSSGTASALGPHVHRTMGAAGQTGHQGAEKRGGGGWRRRGAGQVVASRPPLSTVCYANGAPSSCRNPLLWSVRDGQAPCGPPHHSKVTGPRIYSGVGVGGGVGYHGPPCMWRGGGFFNGCVCLHPHGEHTCGPGQRPLHRH